MMNSTILFRSLIRFYPCISKQSTLQSLSQYTNSINALRLCSTVSCYEDKDPAPLFFSKQVQMVLKKLTGLKLEKVFEEKHLEMPTSSSKWQFLTQDELQKKQELILRKAKHFLQMPPVIKEREPINDILSFDPAIQGLDEAKLVVTDISSDVSDRTRLIVVREPNGILRKATWEERERMNQIYNPRPGRYLTSPQIFQGKFFEDVLNREEYIFLLDFACAHFEPDDPLYHNVTRDAYEHIRMRSNFEALHSTRHYGPMCFYYAWTKKIDALLLFFINQERIEDAFDIVKLYYIINDKMKFEDDTEQKLDFIKKFIAEEAKRKGDLELALQEYEDTIRERETREKTLKASHGIL